MQQTFITPDTEAINARASEAYMTAATGFAKRATQFDGVELPPDERRQLTVLKNFLTMAAPADPKEAAELAQLAAALDGLSAAASPALAANPATRAWTSRDRQILAKDRNPARLLEAWDGWHSIAPPMKKGYARFVELSNKGARELGFADTGAMWRSKYDMPPDAFAKELDRLWEQLRPLYLSLHTYVRARLRQRYGDAVPADGPSQPPARQHLGAGLVEPVSRRGPARRRAGRGL